MSARLKELFPALFAGTPRPLKLRIQADIQQRAPGLLTRAQLSAFLHRYTGSTSYLIALSKATQRFDLDGQPAGELAAEHRQAALDELARRRALATERRELEEQQRRNRAQLLYDFERTTLNRANFCVLKGVPPEQLDELLERARREALEPPPARPSGRPERPHHRPQGRRDDPAQGRREERPQGRSDGRPRPPGQSPSQSPGRPQRDRAPQGRTERPPRPRESGPGPAQPPSATPAEGAPPAAQPEPTPGSEP